MTLYVTSDYSKIIHYGMTFEEYTQYINETVPYTINPTVDFNRIPIIPGMNSAQPVPTISDSLEQE
jgi:hypothetical protein